ncbi:MAG: alpha/beta hydrolase [Pseudomonadota bacterium]
MNAESKPQFLDRQTHQLAFHGLKGSGPTLVWLGGFRSDMDGTKALALEAFARQRQQACLRFDYAGHGKSTGAFTDGTISSWADDAQAMINAKAAGEVVLIGSSMGGWIALLLARDAALRAKQTNVPSPIKGLVLLAPAPDFTQTLMWPRFTEDQRQTILSTGQLSQPSPYDDEPTIITHALIEDGKQNLVLDGTIETQCPVRIIQGVADPDVPHTHALKLFDALVGENVQMTLIKDGDHRLSRPEDIEVLNRTLEALMHNIGTTAGGTLL